jgi:hypothetical protein
MKVAEYPDRKCRQPMESEHFMIHMCDLKEWHPGPCASLSIGSSITRRDAWEKAHPDAKPRDPGDYVA